MLVREPIDYQYPAEVEVLHAALGGDKTAINRVLQYLSSSNERLKQIMQVSIREVGEPQLWRALLGCLAWQRWGLVRTKEAEPDCERRSDPQASRRIDESITEVFVGDTSERERAIKESVLQEALEHSGWSIRRAASYLLALRGEADMIPWLDKMINSAEVEWRLRAIAALAALQDEGCGPPLVRALAQEDTRVHREARKALGELGRHATPALVDALNHKDGHVRWHAARALGQTGDPRAVELLAEGLHDENQAVRWASARTLASLDAQAVPAILSVLCHRPLTEPFRQAAYHALHAMMSRQTQERIEPVLQALRGPGASAEAPAVAQRLLRSWK